MKTLYKKLILSIATITFLTGCGGGGGGGGGGGESSAPTTSTPSTPVSGYVLKVNASTTDTDGDGMTDDAEREFGFDPNDANSFPTEPAVVGAPGPLGAMGPKGPVGDSSNKISYTFDNFGATAEAKWRDFLKKVWPILKSRAGDPAESFNIVIRNMGANSGYFASSNQGRLMQVTETFVPRLIVHELLHAWKGKYLITGDANWNHSTPLSGFEESLAEGLALEIMHQYTKAYPTDVATKQLKDSPHSQYHSGFETNYDAIKFNRETNSGDFWSGSSTQAYRYSIAAVTAQIIFREYPDFYKDTQAKIYEAIRNDSNWRPNRANILAFWKEVAPTIQGIDTEKYINALPVFNGTVTPDGFYIQSQTKQLGTSGETKFGLAYVVNGKEWWRLTSVGLTGITLPTGVKHVTVSSWVYPDMQEQPFNYDVYKAGNLVVTNSTTTSKSYHSDGRPTNLGWGEPEDMQQNNLDLGFYKVNIDFTNFTGENGVSDTFYMFGYKNKTYEKSDLVVMLGGVTGNTLTEATISLDGFSKTVAMSEDFGFFNLKEIEPGYEGVMNITLKDSGNNTCTYKRTLLDSKTQWDFNEHNYIIIDNDFNCTEDKYE